MPHSESEKGKDMTREKSREIRSFLGRSFHAEGGSKEPASLHVSKEPITLHVGSEPLNPIHGRNFRGQEESPNAKIGKKARRL